MNKHEASQDFLNFVYTDYIDPHFLMVLGGESGPLFNDNLLPLSWTEQRWSSMRLLWKRLRRSKNPSSPSISGVSRWFTKKTRSYKQKRTDWVWWWLLKKRNESCAAYFLWSLCGCLTCVQCVAGVLEDLSGASNLVLLPPQAADKEQLGGALGQGRFGLLGQDVTAPLLTLQKHN